MTVEDVLREARRLYAEHPSHAPSGHFPAAGTVCVVLAIDDALEDLTREDWTRDWEYLYNGAQRAFAVAIGGDTQEIVAFNAEHTTDEVLAAFDKAIEAVA